MTTLSETVLVPAEAVGLPGDFVSPAPARAVALFTDGGGSSRQSPRDRRVAAELREAGCGTLLVDLLGESEDGAGPRPAERHLDIPLLAGRLVAAIDWLATWSHGRGLPVILCGAGTGAAAALVAAADRPERVLTVICRGGRPELAGAALERVRTPVLLIAGGYDTEVLRVNHGAARRLRAPHTLHVVPGATHLFEEPGALEEVADTARLWCERHLPDPG
ncbi:dienelactone hydrolase family protein [Streptomyces fumanus]|uniref:dienelactone hydrolase family protein n=1 Tax=Streptomyces fumanus TaxID=67302 RepID=UPI0033F570D4